MRHLVLVVVLFLAMTEARAQPLYTLEQMIQGAIAQCVQSGKPAPYCNCWVRRWVGLWSAYDRDVWVRTAQATPHMQAMESVAARQCSGR